MSNALTGFVVALPAEARTLCQRASAVGERFDIGHGSMVAVSGMGELRAERAAQCLVDAGARGLVSWGCAAGLGPELRPGALCMPQFVITADGNRWPIDEAWRGGVVAALGQRAVSGATLVHATQVLASGAAKRELAAQCGAGVADMESAAIARVAQRYGVPLLVVRSVVDPAGLSLPAVITEHVDESGQVPMGPLLRGLLRQPSDLITMLRLGLGFRSALACLREVVACAGPDLLLEQALRQPPRHAWASSSTHAEWPGPCSTLDA